MSGPKKVPKRGSNYSNDEITCLLDLIEEKKPIGQDWKEVEEEHNGYYPDTQRDVDSLKRKFATLYGSKMPTGDPSCPPVVRRAKRLAAMLSSDAGIMRGDNTYELLPAELAPAEFAPPELPPAVNDHDDNDDNNNNQFLPVEDERNNKGNGVCRPASRASVASSVSSNMSGQRIARSQKKSPQQEEVSNFDKIMMMMAEDRKFAAEQYQREEERHCRQMEQQMKFQNMMMMMMFQRTPTGGGPRSQDDINLGMMHQILSPAAVENNIGRERDNEEDANETQDD
jgi:hypothetical protein